MYDWLLTFLWFSLLLSSSSCLNHPLLFKFELRWDIRTMYQYFFLLQSKINHYHKNTIVYQGKHWLVSPLSTFHEGGCILVPMTLILFNLQYISFNILNSEMLNANNTQSENITQLGTKLPNATEPSTKLTNVTQLGAKPTNEWNCLALALVTPRTYDDDWCFTILHMVG